MNIIRALEKCTRISQPIKTFYNYGGFFYNSTVHRLQKDTYAVSKATTNIFLMQTQWFRHLSKCSPQNSNLLKFIIPS